MRKCESVVRTNFDLVTVDKLKLILTNESNKGFNYNLFGKEDALSFEHLYRSK